MNTREQSATPLWPFPVTIRIGAGTPEPVRGPAEALDYMESRWPYDRGPNFDIAKQRCLEAINSQCSLEVSRNAFIAASIEEKMLA